MPHRQSRLPLLPHAARLAQSQPGQLIRVCPPPPLDWRQYGPVCLSLAGLGEPKLKEWIRGQPPQAWQAVLLLRQVLQGQARPQVSFDGREALT